MSTITPITAASRQRAGTSKEHMIRLQGRMALAGLAEQTPTQPRRAPRPPMPPFPRRPGDGGPRAA